MSWNCLKTKRGGTGARVNSLEEKRECPRILGLGHEQF
jgi:hypothetical protein